MYRILLTFSGFFICLGIQFKFFLILFLRTVLRRMGQSSCDTLVITLVTQDVIFFRNLSIDMLTVNPVFLVLCRPACLYLTRGNVG